MLLHAQCCFLLYAAACVILQYVLCSCILYVLVCFIVTHFELLRSSWIQFWWISMVYLLVAILFSAAGYKPIYLAEWIWLYQRDLYCCTQVVTAHTLPDWCNNTMLRWSAYPFWIKQSTLLLNALLRYALLHALLHALLQALLHALLLHTRCMLYVAACLLYVVSCCMLLHA